MSTNVTIIKFCQFRNLFLQAANHVAYQCYGDYITGIYGTMYFLTYFKYSPHNCHSIVIIFEGGGGGFAAVHKGKPYIN